MVNRLICFFLGMVLSGCVEQKILKTDKLEIIKSVCEQADNQTLVIFDMDNVLTESKERAFQADLYNDIKDIVAEYRISVKKLPSFEQKKLKCAQWLVPVQLVDEHMPELIQQIQSRNIKTLMLTLNPHGKLGSIDSIEELCISRLKSMRIDFCKSWNMSMFKLHDSNKKLLGIFYKGGIFTLSSKELALDAFLKQVPTYKFTKIIFIDDNRGNLKKVRDFAKVRNWDYDGIEYSKVFTKKRQKANINQIKHQFDDLLRTGTWHSPEINSVPSN